MSSRRQYALAFTPDVRSLTATDDAAYILDTEGNLYSSYDLISWQPCGVAWKSITAGYLDKVLGVAADGGVLTHVAYPAIAGATLDAVAKGFPVAETSDMVVVDSQWNINPIGLVTGGTDADGNVTGDTWGFDGVRWAKVSTFAIPPHTGMVMVPYTTFEVGADWKAREYLTLIAFGGQLPDGAFLFMVLKEQNRQQRVIHNRRDKSGKQVAEEKQSAANTGSGSAPISSHHWKYSKKPSLRVW